MKFLPNLLLFHQMFGIYLTFLVLAHDHPGYKAKVQSHYELIQKVAQVLPKYHLKFCYSKKSIFSTNRKDRPLNVCLNLWYWLETSLYLHHWNNPENFHFEDQIFWQGFLFERNCEKILSWDQLNLLCWLNSWNFKKIMPENASQCENFRIFLPLRFYVKSISLF